MKIRVHQVSNKEGAVNAVKIPIEDWTKLSDKIDALADLINERIELIESPTFEFKKVEVQQKRGLADFIMDF
ncbi:MAG: hypothetical protein JEZ03_13340 [Bacteroidales bacterium]|nr:hypothetical protein [Bacteroidales bacterium]